MTNQATNKKNNIVEEKKALKNIKNNVKKVVKQKTRKHHLDKNNLRTLLSQTR